MHLSGRWLTGSPGWLSHQACLLVLSRSCSRALDMFPAVWVLCEIVMQTCKWLWKQQVDQKCVSLFPGRPWLEEFTWVLVCVFRCTATPARGKEARDRCSSGWPRPPLLPRFFLQRIHLLSGSTPPAFATRIAPLFRCEHCTVYSVIYVIYTISLNQTEEKPWVMHKTEFFQIQDERLFPKYLFATDFSYRFSFSPLIHFFFYLFQSVNLMLGESPLKIF